MFHPSTNNPLACVVCGNETINHYDYLARGQQPIVEEARWTGAEMIHDSCARPSVERFNIHQQALFSFLDGQS